MTPLHHERLTDLLWCQVVRDHAGLVERLPFGLRKVEHFGGPHGERDHESIVQIANHAQQTSLAEVDQARSVIDDNAGHWMAGPLICRSTDSSDWLRSAAARTGEISSSPTRARDESLEATRLLESREPMLGLDRIRLRLAPGPGEGREGVL